MTRIANGIAAVLVLSVVPFMAGCKTDISQQLLERELRMQEDQIYLLQDELQEKCARLDRVAGENTSLKKQLGIVDPNGCRRSAPWVPDPVPPMAPGSGRLPANPPPRPRFFPPRSKACRRRCPPPLVIAAPLPLPSSGSRTRKASPSKGRSRTS